MQLRPAQLGADLKRSLRPVYVLHGEEPLLVQEAGQRIVDAAQAAGYVDREVMVADSTFEWERLLLVNQIQSLFGAQRIIGVDGGLP